MDTDSPAGDMKPQSDAGAMMASALLASFWVLASTPRVLARTLWNTRVLMHGRWEDFLHFSFDRSMWSLCYRFWDEALQKTGRYGCTEVLFPKPEPNTTLFMYPLLGLRLNHALGALTYPLAMALWWVSHILYFQHSPAFQVLAVMGLLLCSSSFYGLCFGATNYHAQAFMLFPSALFGIISGQPVVAAFMFLATVPLSPQIIFLEGLAMAWWTVAGLTLTPLLVYLPAGLLTAGMYLYPLWQQGILEDKLRRVAGYLFHSNPQQFVKAERTSPLFWNYAALYTQFAVVGFLFTASGSLRMVAFFPLFFLIFNTFVRITDLQNLVQMNLALAAALTLAGESTLMLISLAVLACPPARHVVFHNFPNLGMRVPELAPVDMRPVFDRLDAFFAPVPDGAWVHAAFEHPGDSISEHGVLSWYRDHFAKHGPYASYIENLFIYALWRRGIALAPTTTMVVYDEAIREQCWGREPEAVRAAMAVTGARHCLHYVKPGETFDETGFAAAGLRSVRRMEAESLTGGVRAGSPFEAGLFWHLLEITDAGQPPDSPHAG